MGGGHEWGGGCDCPIRMGYRKVSLPLGVVPSAHTYLAFTLFKIVFFLNMHLLYCMEGHACEHMCMYKGAPRGQRGYLVTSSIFSAYSFDVSSLPETRASIKARVEASET